jgi:hypothetical protein
MRPRSSKQSSGTNASQTAQHSAQRPSLYAIGAGRNLPDSPVAQIGVQIPPHRNNIGDSTCLHPGGSPLGHLVANLLARALR